MTAEEIVLAIQEKLDGVEWRPDTLEEIAQLLVDNGYRVRDVDDVDREPVEVWCNNCEMLSICGVACHETGCPNMGARWDRESETWIKQRVCFECGLTVDYDDPCCSSENEDDYRSVEEYLDSLEDGGEVEEISP